jgi:transcriptional regulator with XRE-family HTH domain
MNDQSWLHVSSAATAPPDGSDVGEVIRWYRQREGLTQQVAAARLRTTQSRLSKLEKGSHALCDVAELRHIASAPGIPPERLGISPDHSQDSVPMNSLVSHTPGKVHTSQEQWRSDRRELNTHSATSETSPPGWPNSAMAKRYQHVTATLRRDIAQRLNGFLWEGE